MLRMTRITDYSIVVLARLATGHGAWVKSADLAAATRLPQPTVAKILKTLARSGVLKSRRGADGGYALARPAEAISLVEIIEAMEGPLAITECSQPGVSACGESAHCQLNSHWPRINLAVRDALAQVTLAEVCRPPAQTSRPHRGPSAAPSAVAAHHVGVRPNPDQN
jgi:FeS assembly SUF system regulator